MNWNDHSRLQGQHAFLGASKYHWINYDAARIAESFVNYQAKETHEVNLDFHHLVVT